MKVFVTGSTGFPGIHILQELSKDGWKILAFHRPSSDLSDLKKNPGITYVMAMCGISHRWNKPRPGRQLRCVCYTESTVLPL